MVEEKKNKTSSWDFKIDSEAKQHTEQRVVATDRLKEQSLKNKQSSIKNIKVGERKATITRTQLAELEERKRFREQSNVPSSVRQKAFAIDAIYVIVLYYISASSFVMNPIALSIIQVARDKNLTYIIENLPDFKLILAASLFLLFTIVFYLLPIIFTTSSLGKLICRIRIEDTEGGYPSKKNLLIRETIGKLITFISLIGLYQTFIGKMGRSFHDKMTDTVVVKIPPKEKKEVK